MPKSDENVLDIYSGMGGFGTGFNKFFQVTDAVDQWKDACATYESNHKDTKVHHKSVIDYISDLIKKDFEGFLFTGVIGGPPCQDYSVLNYLNRDYGSMRANQLFVFIESVINLQPKFAMLENVATIPKDFKLKAIKMLKNANYKVVAKTVKAYDYGSIQKRRRWILTASKDQYIFPEPIINTRQAKEILIPNSTSEMQMSDKIRNQLYELPKGKWVALPGKKWKEYFIIDPHGPLPAIVNVMKNRIVKPDCSGYLSFQEILQCQGFNPNYILKGSKTSKAQQLANAIPVELAQSFASEFFKRLNPNQSIMDYYL